MDISDATEPQLIAELASRAEYLVIGITTPDPSSRSSLAIYRTSELDNRRTPYILMQAASAVESAGNAAITTP